MKKINHTLITALALLVALSFVGCSSTNSKKRKVTKKSAQFSHEYYEAIEETDRSIEVARLAGAETNCPEAYKKVLKMRNRADEISHFCCDKEEAIVVARAADKMAKELCPPDGDMDGDGIKDSKDKCPTEPEDMDGFQDEDGCPDIDNDQDGIPDVRDNCPNVPEDIDGFQDEDGCPDLDNDEDTIPDVRDGAPNDPETFNGYKDEDGIPDELPARLTLQGVLFQVDSAKLLPEAVEILSEAGSILKTNNDIRVRIEGHASSEAPFDYNQKLSERRAKAVKAFLVKQHGIDANRMETIGYGEERPIANNDTEEGRAKNRRMEFVILEGSLKSDE